MASEESKESIDPGDNGPLRDLNRFTRRLSEQDERAMVLSLAAFLEEALGRLLLAYLRNCKATRDLVEGFNAPLGTLSSRIKAAYSFGLATEEQYKDMEILRKIRNLFAHDWQGVTIERNDVAAMIGQLSGFTFDQEPIQGGPKERLRHTIANCCIELFLHCTRIEEGKSVKAADVSFRLTTTPPTGSPRVRYVD